jgi:hypothetical protein
MQTKKHQKAQFKTILHKEEKRNTILLSVTKAPISLDL